MLQQILGVSREVVIALKDKLLLVVLDSQAIPGCKI
jgi:hypothetical protein